MSPPDQKDPLDRLLEVAVFGPLGALLSAREALPHWVEKGRQEVSAQLPLARVVGEIAVRQGTRQARQGLDRLRRQAEDLLDDTARPPAQSERGEPAQPAPPPPRPERLAPPAARAVPDEDGLDAPPGPDVGELPIPGYDTLSASQVVQRLPGLSAGELEAVRRYEVAGRARKTVLLRIAQLGSAS